MKIIEPCKKLEPKILHFECPNCWHVFHIYDTARDALGRERVVEKHESTIYSVKCPVCGEKVEINV